MTNDEYIFGIHLMARCANNWSLGKIIWGTINKYWVFSNIPYEEKKSYFGLQVKPYLMDWSFNLWLVKHIEWLLQNVMCRSEVGQCMFVEHFKNKLALLRRLLW